MKEQEGRNDTLSRVQCTLQMTAGTILYVGSCVLALRCTGGEHVQLVNVDTRNYLMRRTTRTVEVIQVHWEPRSEHQKHAVIPHFAQVRNVCTLQGLRRRATIVISCFLRTSVQTITSSTSQESRFQEKPLAWKIIQTQKMKRTRNTSDAAECLKSRGIRTGSRGQLCGPCSKQEVFMRCTACARIVGELRHA